MITMKLANNPGYPTHNPDYLGTIHHTENGVAASINSDYQSTWLVRRYMCGLEPNNYPLPAIRYEVEYIFEVGICYTDDKEERLGPDVCITRMLTEDSGLTVYEYEDGKTKWKCVTRRGKWYYMK